MEIATTRFIECLGAFAKQYGHLRVRESGYSHLLFSYLRQEYGNVFMTGVGITLDDLKGVMGDKEQALVAKYLRKSQDLYPDLVMFRQRILDLDIDEISRFRKLPVEACPLMLCEWKFFSSFPSMPRQTAMIDAAKLELVSHYLNVTTGQRPELLQVIFNFPSPGHKEKRFREWYRWGELPSEIPHVRAVMVLPNGEAEVLTNWIT